jgi:hypothetical protein
MKRVCKDGTPELVEAVQKEGLNQANLAFSF